MITALNPSSEQVHAVHAVAEPGKATQIPLDWVLAALRCQTAAAPQQVRMLCSLPQSLEGWGHNLEAMGVDCIPEYPASLAHRRRR